MSVEVLVMRGVSEADCRHKIADRYGIYFHVLRTKIIPKSFFGLFPREAVEIEFCLTAMPTPVLRNESAAMPTAIPAVVGGRQVQQRERQVAAAGGGGNDVTVTGGGTTLDFTEAKKKLIAAAGKDPEKILREARGEDQRESESRTLLEEIRELKEEMRAGGGRPAEHPVLVRITEMLRLNGFSQTYTAGILKRVRAELPLETLDNFDTVQSRVLEWIGESIAIFPVNERPPRQVGDGHSARIMVLVGPTGVGKTTTIAKLAAVYGLDGVSGRRPLSVHVISIDAFRIGAQHQIEGFTKIMEIPVSFIDNHKDLQREIDLHREVTDMIIVDTTGRSPRDSAKLGEMKQILDACGSKAEVHLAVAAGTKTDDLLTIMRQFEPFNYGAVLLTKLDETAHVGNIISALAEKGKPVSYITDGQIVPRDIKKASVVQFLINLEDFRVDREALQKRFPVQGADRSQWS